MHHLQSNHQLQTFHVAHFLMRHTTNMIDLSHKGMQMLTEIVWGIFFRSEVFHLTYPTTIILNLPLMSLTTNQLGQKSIFLPF